MSRERKFKLGPDEIKPLIEPIGGCFATHHITVDGLPVGFMEREAPGFDVDSGWRFYSGTETEDYANNPDNTTVYDVNTIANYDPAIIPYLDSPAGSELERIPGTSKFRKIKTETSWWRRLWK
jgi:hypothetical protein